MCGTLCTISSRAGECLCDANYVNMGPAGAALPQSSKCRTSGRGEAAPCQAGAGSGSDCRPWLPGQEGSGLSAPPGSRWWIGTGFFPGHSDLGRRCCILPGCGAGSCPGSPPTPCPTGSGAGPRDTLATRGADPWRVCRVWLGVCGLPRPQTPVCPAWWPGVVGTQRGSPLSSVWTIGREVSVASGFVAGVDLWSL